MSCDQEGIAPVPNAGFAGNLISSTPTGERRVRVALSQANIIIANSAAFALALLIAVGLKMHYSTATVDQLAWIMKPTAVLVECCTGVLFVEEAGVGYVNHEHRVVIAKACAGINFLIIAFCMLAFTLIGGAAAGGRPFLLPAQALVAAYLSTVVVNGVRIMIALGHAGDAAGSGWFTPERVHRIEGIVVYFAALLGLFLLAGVIVASRRGASQVAAAIQDRRQSRLRARLLFVPFGWYVAMTLGVPLLNGALWNDPAQFGEHALWVLGVPLCLAGALLLVSHGWRLLYASGRQC